MGVVGGRILMEGIEEEEEEEGEGGILEVGRRVRGGV
jgi:hypothetical protein